jgi:hypothetical protein
MSFNHENKITYRYTSAGATETKEITKTETGTSEINISKNVTMGATVTADLDIPGFDYASKAAALSVYLRIDGVKGTLYSDASSNADIIANLDDGVPFVWSKNGGTNFPPGALNPMFDSTTSLVVKPSGYHAVHNPLAIHSGVIAVTARILYDAV